MLMTVSAPQADRARALRATGASVSDLVRHKAKGVIQQTYHEVGFNYRLTDIQAAIGLVQLGRLDEILRARAMQARLPQREPVQIVLHDRGGKFCPMFREVIQAGNGKPLKLPARSPNLNVLAARWVRSVKKNACRGWSWLIIFGRAFRQVALSILIVRFLCPAL